MKEISEIAADFHQHVLQQEHLVQTLATQDIKAELKRCRIIYWYHSVRLKAGLTSARSMQRKFEPGSFVRVPGLPSYHSNKWGRYRSGKNKPCAARVKRVESLIPGSANELTRVLWSVLDVNRQLGRRAGHLLRRLEPDVQRAIFCNPARITGRNSRKSSNSRIATSLRNLASLDSLAALTLLTREALEKGKPNDAYFWAEQTYYMLIKFAVELHARGVGHSIVRLYHDQIFSRVDSNGYKFHDTVIQITEASAQIAILVFETPGSRDVALSFEDRFKRMSLLLRGKCGWDVPFAMRPRWAPSRAATPFELRYQSRQERLRKWGWDCIYGRVPRESWPPLEIFAGMGDEQVVSSTQPSDLSPNLRNLEGKPT